MATSSITKQFVVKDAESVERLLQIMEESEEFDANDSKPSKLQSGKELIKSFSPNS